MRTLEIPKRQWASFFSGLIRDTGGHAVRLEVENLDLGAQEMAELLPLHDLDLEMKGSDAGAIEITVGGHDDELSHRIEKPVRIYAIVDASETVSCVSIEDSTQGKTLLYFEDRPSLPRGPDISQPSASAP